jgi:NTP pyrophosphatase (non-canonical NTP hydrolase)
MKNESRFTIGQLQKLVFLEYEKNGYLENWTQFEEFKELQSIFDIAELGLISTEVSEAIESIRTDKISIGYELADIIIRVMNFASRKDIDLESAILEKNSINLNRGKLHGKTV